MTTMYSCVALIKLFGNSALNYIDMMHDLGTLYMPTEQASVLKKELFHQLTSLGCAAEGKIPRVFVTVLVL